MGRGMCTYFNDTYNCACEDGYGGTYCEIGKSETTNTYCVLYFIETVAERLLLTFMSGIDNCNSLLDELPDSQVNKLKGIQITPILILFNFFINYYWFI